MGSLVFKFVAVVLLWLGFLQSAFSSIEYRYFYDELGQLIKATDSTGSIIEYVYDEVGNHVAVKRTDGSGFAILSVSPATGSIGSEVVIEGRGFSATVSEDKVTFDGIPATIVSASPTQLVVIVPDGISAGVIAVSVGGKTITADSNFHTAAIPVISSVSHPYVLSGATISNFTVTGNFLTGAVFSFSPSLTPAALSINSVSIADDGKSAVFTVNVSSSAIGTFVLQAANADGQSDAFGSAANTLTVLGAANADSDGDGLTNEEEIARGTNPTSGDTDNDGLPDKYELDHGLDPNNPLDAFLDSDKDGFDNLTEFERGTDPQNSDITPPAVDQVIPAKEEINFPTNGKIVVRFTEPLQPTSVLPGTIRLFQDSLAIIGDVVLSSDQLSITFDPKESLSAFTEYKVQVQSVRDQAGNPMDEVFESTFTTGEFIDDIRPALTATSIINGAEDVPVNTPYTVLFSEAMNPSSLTDKTFVIRDGTTSRDVEGMIQVDPSGMTASFVPESPFAVGRSFTVILNTAITDISGNLLDRSYFFSFMTAFDEDNTPPTVTQISPSDGISGVPPNANVMVEFSDPLDRISIVGAITLQADGADIPGSIALSNGNRRATFTPATNLAPSTVITVKIDGKIKDIAGNALGTVVSSQFTTGTSVDFVGPSVISASPFNGENNVPVNVMVQVEFSEWVNPLTVTENSFYLLDKSTNQKVKGLRSISTDGEILTFTPEELLKEDSGYIIFANTEIRDLANNNVNIEFLGRFTTGAGVSTRSFAIIGTNIPDGITEVPVKPEIVIQFSEAIRGIDLPADALVLLAGTEPVPGAVSVTSDRLQLVYRPASNLKPSTLHTIKVSGVVGVSGRTLAPFTSRFTTSATTAADTVRPTITAVNPLNGATGVRTDVIASVQFSERISPLTVTEDTLYIEQVTDVVAKLAGKAALTSDGLIATFTPDQPLLSGKQYRIRVTGGIQDFSGNSYSGSSVPSTFTVDTGGAVDSLAPRVLMVTPADGTTGVQSDVNVVLTFSESLDPRTVTPDTVALLVEGSARSTSITRSSDNRTIILSTSLPADSEITVVVTNGVKDLAGNALAGFTSTFRTEDLNRPSINGQRPVNGADNIPINQSIVLFASESLQASTIPAALHVSQNGVIVEGTVNMTPGGRSIEFTPKNPWEHNALIQVFLEDTARDLKGNALYDFQGSFRTIADPRALSPTLLRANITADELPANPLIELEFSEELDVATISDATIKLFESTGGKSVTGAVSLRDKRFVRFIPDTPLKASTRYYVDVLNGILDLDSQAIRPGSSPETVVYRNFFTTGNTIDTTVPVVVAVSPPEGWTDVALNSNIRVRLSERINPLTVTASTISITDGTTTVVPHTIRFADKEREILIPPLSPLAAGKVYTLKVSGIEDNAGNRVGEYISQFTTGSAIDTDPPGVIATTPSPGEEDVPRNTPIIVEMNEPIDPTSVNEFTFAVEYYYRYFDEYGPGDGYSDISGTRSVSADGRMISFVPDMPLIPASHDRDSEYRIRIRSIADFSGNHLVASFLTFTTAFVDDTAAPQITGVSPQDGLADVARNARIVVRFDEPIQSLSDDQIKLSAGGTEIEVTQVWADGNRLLHLISPRPLAANAVHTVTIGAGVKDIAGNALGTVVSSQFTTGSSVDIVGPSVISASPFNDEKNVPVNTVIQVEVNERINPLAVTESGFYLYDTTTGRHVSGKRSVSTDGQTLTLTPDELLKSGRTYYVYAPDIRDLANNRLVSSAFIASFVTAP